MGIIKKQFIDVIDWNESSDTLLAYRFPMEDSEIQNGGQLVVRESQKAIFVNEGKIADVFGAGTYALDTKTLPVLTNLRNWDKLFASPFKSDVYYFSSRIQLNRKWGTPTPVTIRDEEFGTVSLRAFGIFSYHILDPKLFFTQISGTRESYQSEQLEGQLRGNVVTAISAIFGNSKISFVDMASNLVHFSQELKEQLVPTFSTIGLGLDSLLVESISLPDDLSKSLHDRISVDIMGGMQNYTQYQVARSIPIAAENEGGLAGIGAGLGVGLGVGQKMSDSLGRSLEQPTTLRSDSADSAIETIQKLHQLMTDKVITEEEFEAKKAELLKRIT